MTGRGLISPGGLVLLAGAGSAAALLGAWYFEFVVGLAPCAMCYWQRWPHMAAVAIAALAVAPLSRPQSRPLPRSARVAVALAGAAAAATTAAIGLYHTGVERGWWAGPSACSGGGQDLGALSGAALLDFEAAERVVLCDEVAWSMLGLSMASWNALFSAGLVLLWLAAAAWRGPAVNAG